MSGAPDPSGEGIVATLAPGRVDGPVIDAERDEDGDEGARHAPGVSAAPAAATQAVTADVAVQVSSVDDDKHAKDVQLHHEVETAAQEHAEAERHDAEEARQQEEVVEAVADTHEPMPEPAPEPAEQAHDVDQTHQE